MKSTPTKKPEKIIKCSCGNNVTEKNAFVDGWKKADKAGVQVSCPFCLNVLFDKELGTSYKEKVLDAVAEVLENL